jgi:hypothetical protein
MRAKTHGILVQPREEKRHVPRTFFSPHLILDLVALARNFEKRSTLRAGPSPPRWTDLRQGQHDAKARRILLQRLCAGTAAEAPIPMHVVPESYFRTLPASFRRELWYGVAQAVVIDAGGEFL